MGDPAVAAEPIAGGIPPATSVGTTAVASSSRELEVGKLINNRLIGEDEVLAADAKRRVVAPLGDVDPLGLGQAGRRSAPVEPCSSRPSFKRINRRARPDNGSSHDRPQRAIWPRRFSISRMSAPRTLSWNDSRLLGGLQRRGARCAGTMLRWTAP